MNAIIRIFYNNKERYGYRRIGMSLRNEGYAVNDKKVQRLMKKMNLQARKRSKRKYSSYQGTIGKIADNRINRQFIAFNPNEKWYTDVTEFHLNGQKLYLSVIIDGFNQEVIAHSLSASPNLNHVIYMLDEALGKFDNLNGLILHSDQGWQYQHATWQKKLKSREILQSMSRKGNSLDNALMENFFGLLKTEMFYDQEYSFKDIKQLEKGINEYIVYFNNERIKAKLKGLSPVNYRIQSLNNAA